MDYQSTTLEQEPAMVFAPDAQQPPGLELCVNFGLCTGREATPAEIELLGQELLVKVGRVTIVSERRYEIGADAEATVHQLRVQFDPAALESKPDHAEFRGRLLEVTESWLADCIAARHL
jgi:hypothetical protein